MAGESITFSFGADTRGMTDAIDGLLGKLAGLAAAFLSAQAIIQAFGEAIDLGSRLNDLSNRTGETAGNLALLERAFTNTSVGAEKVGPAISKMQVAITDFAQGSDKAVAAFAQLGLSLEDLQQHTPTEQLQMIGERLAAIHDPALRAATAVDIFGRSGAELLPVLTNFSAEMAQASMQMGSLPEMLDRTAATVDSLGDNLDAIKNKGVEMAYGFLSEVAPAVDFLAQKLAGLDAAGIGAGMADAMVGAFVQPQKSASLLGDTLLLGVKVMGNEMIYQIRYWAELLFNTFKELGVNIFPMLGNNMLGALEIAAGGFGQALLEAIEAALQGLSPLADFLGFGDQLQTAIASVQQLQEDANQMMVDGFAKIAEGSQIFDQAFERAKANSTVIREDITGANVAAADMADKFEDIRKDAQAAVEAFSTTEAAESRTTTGTGIDPLMNILINENKVQQTAIATGGSKSQAAAEAKAYAEAMKALGLIADAEAGTAIGRTAAAQRAQDIQKQIATLSALGADPARIQRLTDSMRTNLDIAMGAQLTAGERDAARDFAAAALNDPTLNPQGLSFSELENMKKEEILGIKEDALGINDILKKNQGDKQAEQAKKAGEPQQQEKQANTVLGIAQQLLKLMQNIEPRIPVANLQ